MKKSWINKFIESEGLKPIVKREMISWHNGKARQCDCIEMYCETLAHNVRNIQDRIDGNTTQRRDKRKELQRLQTAFAALSNNTRDHLSVNCVLGLPNVALRLNGQGSIIQAIENGIDTTIEQCKGSAPRGKGHASTVKRAFVREAALIFLMMGGKRLSPDNSSIFALFLCIADTELGLNVRQSKAESFKRVILQTIGKTETERRATKAKLIKELAPFLG